MRKSAILCLPALFLALPVALQAAPPALTADQILKDVRKQLDSKDDSARVTMTIIESDGSKKERSLDILRRTTGSGQAVMVRLRSPADLRGTSLLSVTQGEKTDQWLYLPSSKQTRRVQGGSRRSSFLDSELSYEDLDSSAAVGATNRILRTEADGTTVIESAIASPDSAYSRIVSWVAPGDRIAKAEYYDRAGKLVKTSEMSDYQKFSGRVWRAKKVFVRNVQKNRATELDLVNLKVDQGLTDEDFAPSALAN